MQNSSKSFDQHRYLFKIQHFLLLTLLFSIYSCKAQNIAAVTNEAKIMLRDGVVVNLEKKFIYFANKEGIVEGIEFESGKTIWQSDAKGRPLCLFGEKLIVQLDQNENDTSILFGELDTGDKGKLTNQAKVSVPDKIKTRVSNSVDGSFYLTPYKIKDAFIFQWAYFPPLSGDYNEDEEMKKQSGAIRFDGSDYKNVKSNTLPEEYNIRPIQASKEQRISKENAQQFVSKNGKHLLVSSRDVKSTAFQNYKWEVFDLATKKRIGVLQSHVSYSSFVVFGNHLLLERGPYETFNKEVIDKTPLQLALFDLRDGKELWTRDILDTTYRGPSPP